MPLPASLTLRTACLELGHVKSKAYEIGVALGIPRKEMLTFKQEGDILSSAVDYWLSGNIPDAPITWGYLAEALESSFVEETGCAQNIKKKYIINQCEDSKNEKGLAMIIGYLLYLANENL